jgi:hypothetical protein
MPFRRIIRGKSKLSANYPADSFSIPRKVKISPLLKLILDKNSTMGDQHYHRFGRKNVKIWYNLLYDNFFDFPQVI